MTAKTLAKIGKNALKVCRENKYPQAEAIVEAVAAMLAETTKKATPRKEGDLSHPRKLHEAMAADCTEWVDVSTWTKGSFGRLGRQMNEINGWGDEEIPSFVAYINSGALAWHKEKGIALTWDWIVKNFVSLVGKSRAHVPCESVGASAIR